MSLELTTAEYFINIDGAFGGCSLDVDAEVLGGSMVGGVSANDLVVSMGVVCNGSKVLVVSVTIQELTKNFDEVHDCVIDQ